MFRSTPPRRGRRGEWRATAPGEVTVERRGYEAARVAITDAAWSAGRLVVPLEPAEVNVRLSASGPYAFEVVDGSRTVSGAAQQHSVSLPEGRQVRLRAPGVFLDQRVVVRGGAGGAMRVALRSADRPKSWPGHLPLAV